MDIHYFGRAISWMGLGDYDKSLECFDKSLEANPKTQTPGTAKVLLYIQGKIEESS
jgi:tetratricopeptide (TPR) repeat protein